MSKRKYSKTGSGKQLKKLSGINNFCGDRKWR
jgi:hypothetical protein